MRESAGRQRTRFPTGADGSSPSGFRPLELVVLLAIVALGLWLRWAYLQEIRFTPEFSHPLIDPLFNDYWARGIATGDWSSTLVMRAYGYLPDIQNLPYFRAPGYAYFLAGVYRVLGPDYMVVRLVQMGVGLLSAVVAFLLGRALFGRAVGLVFAGFMSIYWGFIYFEAELAEPSVLILLLLLFVYLLYRCARFAPLPNAPMAGLALGLAVLMRPNVLLLGVAAIVWGWWVVRHRRGVAWFRVFSPPRIRSDLVEPGCQPVYRQQ